MIIVLDVSLFVVGTVFLAVILHVIISGNKKTRIDQAEKSNRDCQSARREVLDFDLLRHHCYKLNVKNPNIQCKIQGECYPYMYLTFKDNTVLCVTREDVSNAFLARGGEV